MISGGGVREKKTLWERAETLDSGYKDFWGKELTSIWFQMTAQEQKRKLQGDFLAQKCKSYDPSPTLAIYNSSHHTSYPNSLYMWK